MSLAAGLSDGERLYAQEHASAAISGTVTDPSGALIPGAEVRLLDPARPGVTVGAVQTDRAGRFRLEARPGTFQLQVESEGFGLYTSPTLHLRLGSPMNVPVRLAIAARSEQVDVSDARNGATDPDSNGSALHFGGERLNILSDDPATLQQQINALAGPGLGGNTQILVNGFSGGRLPPKGSIRSLSINGNPFSAYYDSPGFGRVEIETKPGGDKVHGALNFAGTDQPFDARNPFTTVQPPFFQFQTDGNVTGPLGKKTSFFGAENIQQLGNNAVVNAVLLDSQFASGTYSTAVPAPQLGQIYSARLDRQFSTNNFGFVRDEWSRTHTTNDGLAPLLLPSSAYTSNTLTETLQAADTQLLGLHAVNEVRFQYLRSRLRQDPNNTETGLLVEGAFQQFGSPTQVLRDNQDHYEGQERFEFDRGKHAVRVGARFRAVREANLSSANFNGQYVFNDIASYAITEQGLAGHLSPAQIRAEGGGAAQFSITTGQPRATLLNDDAGVYAEDDWRLDRDITASYGFRFESESAVPDHADAAPRLGLAWAVHRGKKPAPLVVLRTGYGIFYNRFPSASLLQAVRQNGVSETAFFAQNPDTFAQNADGSPIAPPPSQLTATEPTIYRVNPALRAAYSQVASFGADRFIGRRGTVSAMFLYAHGAHGYLTRNINAPLPGTFNPTLPNSGVRPLGTAQNIYQYSSDSNENDEVLFTNSQLQVTKTLFVFASYILQRQANESAGVASFPSNQYNLRADYAPDAAQHKQTLNSAILWTLPYGLQSGLFFNAHSGTRFDITTGTDLNGDTIFNDRPGYATDLSRPSVVRTTFGNFDSVPLPGAALVPRNAGDAPALLWLDLQLRKSFHVGPRAPIQGAGTAASNTPGSAPGRSATKPDRPWQLGFQIDAQNVLNHTNPGVPIGVLPTPGEPLCHGLQTATACSYFGQSLSLANDFSPLTASNRTILVQSFFTF